MTNSNLIHHVLLSLGAHIGHEIYFHDNEMLISQLLSGSRNDWLIIDVKRTAYFLKRALIFLYKVNSRFSFNLFYNATSTGLHWSIRHLLTKLVTSNSMNNVYMDLPWTGGTITNYRHCFLRFLSMFCSDFKRLRRRSKKKKQRTSTYIYSAAVYKYLIIKLLHILDTKILDLEAWHKSESFYKNLLKVLIFYRTYKYIFRIPDVFCVLCSTGRLPSDFLNRHIPSIGIVDTPGPINAYTYPIPSNDDSIVLLFFYFKLFTNVIRTASYRSYMEFEVSGINQKYKSKLERWEEST